MLQSVLSAQGGPTSKTVQPEVPVVPEMRNPTLNRNISVDTISLHRFSIFQYKLKNSLK